MRLAANQSLWEGKLRFYGSAVGTIVNSSYINPAIYCNTLLVNPTASIKDVVTGDYTFFQDADHRIGLSIYAISDILNGDLDQLIEPIITHYQALALQGKTEAPRASDDDADEDD